MRSGAEVDLVLGLATSGKNPSEIARITGISRGTVRDWVAGRLPHSATHDDRDFCLGCGGEPHDFADPPAVYPYLLGIYLGDGCISIHRRNVARLRVYLDSKYPQIIEETRRAIAEMMPANRIHIDAKPSKLTDSDELTTVIVSAYSKGWPCWLPQHGPGKKHERPIVLHDWQRAAVDLSPGLFLRGLIHSDGCRFMNTGTNWSNPRYSFSNQSADIRGLFTAACERLGLHTTSAPHTVYVSRKADVAELDKYVGPKR